MKNSLAEKRVKITSIGAMAHGWLLPMNTLRVIAVFHRSFYCCDSKNNIVCIGQEDIGQGPFTLICSLDCHWPESALTSSKQINIIDNQLILDETGITFDMNGAAIWRKSLSSILEHTEHLKSDISHVAMRAGIEAPPESLGGLMSSWFPWRIQPVESKPDCLSQALHNRFDEVVSDIDRPDFFHPDGSFTTSFAQHLCLLMGLGSGLTPSGDDFLAGFIMGLFKAGEHDRAKWLAQYLYHRARTKATVISLAFYRALAEGFVAESYHRFLEIIGSGDLQGLDQRFRRVSQNGATSGWDTIAGIVFGVSFALSALDGRRDRAVEVAC